MAWRAIVRAYAPEASGRFTAMLMGLLAPDWSDTEKSGGRSFEEALADWETKVTRYEMEASETVSQGVRIAVVAKHAPTHMKHVVRLASVTAKGEYSIFRDQLGDYLQTGKTYDTQGAADAPVPRDVGAVEGGKSKGKGKKCDVCGKPGHAKKDC
eukprot:14425327-Alexandrium_andersonii.AAC.1